LRPALGIKLEPEFGGDHHLSTERRERLAHELLVLARSIDFSGVEECDAMPDGGPDERNHLLRVVRRTVAEAHSHAAEPDGGNLQVAAAKFAFFHVANSHFDG
jgi:hypothetical protein